ncbi:MAG: lmo0937 family membrane protein [Vicinamibacterales bacterium]
MLNTILILLVVLWLLGMVSSYTMGGFIHLLLVICHRDDADSHHPGPQSRLTVARARP